MRPLIGGGEQGSRVIGLNRCRVCEENKNGGTKGSQPTTCMDFWVIRR